MTTSVKFVAPEGDKFWPTLRERVDQYFKESGRSRYWNGVMLTKTIGCLGLYLGGWALLWQNSQTPGLWLLPWVLTGLGMAEIGFNIAHDASHDAYSSKQWVNRLLAHTFTLVGVHEYNWNITHNILHHTYTNIPYADGDLHPVPYLRYFNIDQERRWYHRFQHVYALALYCLASIVWVFYKDYLHISRKFHVTYEKPKPPLSEYLILLVAKLGHYALFLLIPFFVIGLPWQHVLVGFVLMHVVAGFCLASVFAIGHVVEGVPIVTPDEKGIVHESWAAHQLRTSANFNLKSRFFFWTVGGLNFQAEHHLFPRICHVHYPKIAPIVKATAKEFGVPYNEFPTFRSGVAAHLQHLKTQAQLQETPPPAPAAV